MIDVLFFGPVAERVGARQIDMAFHPGLRWQDVRDELRTRYPEAFKLVSIVAVNGKRVSEQDEQDKHGSLADGSEVVFMSAFSGG
ncbi:MAG: MoaD/ThiS family protein [Azoarcus sp.]|jgi:molybdopterin converting factor small subunit|nr:MoaD/ThiS family protein [Azoarcus sp.]